MSSKPEQSPSDLRKEDILKQKKVSIQQLWEELSKLNDQIIAIGSQVKSVNDQIGAIGSQVKSVNDQIGAIGSQVKSVNDQIQIVDSKQKKVSIQQFWEDFFKLNEQVGVIKAQVRSVNDQAQIIDSKLNVLNNRLEIQFRKEPTKKDLEKQSSPKKVESFEVPKKQPEKDDAESKKKWWQLRS